MKNYEISNTRTKLEGLKQLIAMMSTGRDVSHFFPSVVVNIVTESFEVKALVYMFLVRTAEQKPDEALLSINSFQKDLAHQNAEVRAAALEGDVEHSSESDRAGGGFGDSEVRGGRVAAREEGGGARDSEDFSVGSVESG